MTALLGKRKRQKVRTDERDDADGDHGEENGDLQAIFQRHFEAQFKPLQQVKKGPQKETAVVEREEDEEEEEEEEEEESDWGGFSDHSAQEVEVIEHTTQASRDRASKDEMKAFMSSKPPSAVLKTKSTASKRPPDTADEDNTDAANLKNDLALQRLLNESHLLDNNTAFSPSGRNRHKATDLRLRTLGAKTSILTQEKMPLSHRKGIVAKASQREEKRRLEAKENGIILERATKVKKGTEGKRERGVGAPSVGRFSGGMLKLSKKDVMDIEGPRRNGKGKKGSRR
ncbi:MAG: hypothetical protein M1819_007133 [Sarea resinae]|nr:MAG: hypothetical protein M1819_007133 [Sarea resinae]